jgi:hypothetical protein
MRRDTASALLLVAGVAACFGTVAACGRITGLDALTFDLTDGGTGNRSTSSSSGSSSGTGGMTACTEASQCPDVPPGPCASLGKKTCADGGCGVTYTVGRAPSQVYGNCQQNDCDATGKMTSVEDDTNVVVSNDPCATWVCAGGSLMASDTTGKACPFPPMGTMTGVCEPNVYGEVVCSQCSNGTSSVCMGATVCAEGKCVPNACSNNTAPMETDTDCGGPCAPCGTGKKCTAQSDCISGVCSGMPKVCQQASCDDGVPNGLETDTDCGGGPASCPPCPVGDKCALPTDCESSVCMPVADAGPPVCAAPTCTDGVQNGLETGVDCGGPDVDGGPSCPPCAP